MPLDPSIILGVRPPQIENPVNQYAQVMAIQNAGNQNALAQYQLSKARRDDDDQNALRASLRGVDINTPEGLSKARNALMSIGNVKGAQELGKNALETKKLTGEITAQDIKAAKDRFDAFSGLIAPLAMNPNVTHDEVFAAGSRAQAMGLVPDGWQSSVPQNAMQLPEWVKGLALATEQGRKSVEMLKQKIDWRGTGQQDIPIQSNSLAAGFGQPVAGIAPIQKVMAPVEVATAANQPFKPDGTPNLPVQTYQLGKAKAAAPKVSVDTRAESTYAQTVGKGSAERDEAQVTAALAVPENVAKIDQLINHLESSDALTGLGAEVFKNVERARTLLTQNEKAGKRVSDTELLDAMLGSDVFPMIGALGIGARGLDTPAEREFLRKVMTGTVDMNKDTLLRMAKIRRSVSERVADRYNNRVEKGELDRYFKYSGMPKNKVDVKPQDGAVQIKTDADYAKLPSGAVFVGPDGKQRRKP